LRDKASNNPLWLAYGETLLKLGRGQKGQAILSDYLQNHPDADTRKTVANALYDAQLYREAEPHFEYLFAHGQPEQLGQPMRYLALIYRATGRSAQLSELVEEYLERAQNPTRARQQALQ